MAATAVSRRNRERATYERVSTTYLAGFTRAHMCCGSEMLAKTTTNNSDIVVVLREKCVHGTSSPVYAMATHFARPACPISEAFTVDGDTISTSRRNVRSIIDNLNLYFDWLEEGVIEGEPAPPPPPPCCEMCGQALPPP